MKYKVFDFYKKDKNIRRKCIGRFFKEQWDEIFISYLFILLSSGLPFFALTNGAIWVLVWYTATLLLSMCIFISQYEYNLATKKAVKFAKKHSSYIVKKGYKYSAEIGGWNFFAAQFICLPVLIIMLGGFSIITQFHSLADYLDKYKDFCIGVFADTYVLLFVNIYYKAVILEVKSIYGWKNKVKYFLHTFDKPIILNALVHIGAQVIMIGALYYYFTREFAGLFSPILRRVIGLIYIMYMAIDVKSVFRKMSSKLKQ